ncbi:MAG: hypothetical protein ACR652_21470 [Methylocystis sp.]|uniref:hypothetical protein n=1 Tax=Methylocystis sp. TaxID=1911079 RepID=UPI003DA6A969
MAAAADRVQSNTSEAVNRMIHAEMLERLIYFALHPDRIGGRLEELDREWDVERALEANASAFGLGGLTLGFLGSRRWLALPALVSGFLMQHAIQGWCPPLPVLRRLGFRTQREIDQERYALKALRGDFRQVEDAMTRLQAARTEKQASGPELWTGST